MVPFYSLMWFPMRLLLAKISPFSRILLCNVRRGIGEINGVLDFPINSFMVISCMLYVDIDNIVW